MIRLDDYQRAMAQVRDYLDREVFSRDPAEGTRLPPVRALARSLGVSNAAVYAVYRELQERGQVISVVGKGTFINPIRRVQRKIVIALLLTPQPRGVEGVAGACHWINSLVAGTLGAAAESSEVIVRPLDRSIFHGGEAGRAELEHEIAEIDGLICYPMLPAERAMICAYLHECGKPVIFVNPPEPFSTENFVSADYYHFGQEMGRVWLESGRHRLLLMGSDPDTPSWVQRMAGFQNAVGKHHDCLSVVHARSLDREAGYEAMRATLQEGKRPDAIFAFGDLLAIGVRDALLEAQIRVPGEVSIVGGTGMQEMQQQGISTHCNDYNAIGRAALEMIVMRLRNGGASLPARYIPIGFTPAGSTRPLEATIWRQQHKP